MRYLHYGWLCLLAANLLAAPPTFQTQVACPPLTLRLPATLTQQPTPVLDTFRYTVTYSTGKVEELDCFDPTQLWRNEQRLGAWKDKFGNAYELVKLSALMASTYPNKHVPKETFYESLIPFTYAASPQWFSAWFAESISTPETLKPIGQIKQACVFTSESYAILLFSLRDEEDTFYALIVQPLKDTPASWKRALSLSLPGIKRSGVTTAQTSLQKGWSTIEAPPYRIITDLKPRNLTTLKQLLGELTLMRTKGYANFFPVPESGLPPSTIRIFAHPEDYRTYVDPAMAWSSGYFSSQQRELVLSGDESANYKQRRDELRTLMFHEGFHQYLFLITPSCATIPLWFNEGFATYFEVMRIKQGVPKRGRSPRLPIAQAYLKHYGSLAIKRLMLADAETFYTSDQTELSQNYARAYALITYLQTAGTPTEKKALATYYALLCKGTPPAEALESVWPDEKLLQLEQHLQRWLQKE